mmetsp:Transcript_3331/g.6743  ORF Transcript_3331/g.6743 Transcript_3331/m.6743 type:complete len:816 (-) Transcript_3331:1515-3962(-)
MHTEELPTLRLLRLKHYRRDHWVHGTRGEIPRIQLPGGGHGLLKQIAHLVAVGGLRGVEIIVLLVVEIPGHAALLQVVQAQLLAAAGGRDPREALEWGGHDALASRAAGQGVAATGGSVVRLDPGGSPVSRHQSVLQASVRAHPHGGGYSRGPSQPGVLREGQAARGVLGVLDYLHRRNSIVAAGIGITCPPLGKEFDPSLALLAGVAIRPELVKQVAVNSRAILLRVWIFSHQIHGVLGVSFGGGQRDSCRSLLGARLITVSNNLPYPPPKIQGITIGDTEPHRVAPHLDTHALLPNQLVPCPAPTLKRPDRIHTHRSLLVAAVRPSSTLVQVGYRREVRRAANHGANDPPPAFCLVTGGVGGGGVAVGGLVDLLLAEHSGDQLGCGQVMGPLNHLKVPVISTAARTAAARTAPSSRPRLSGGGLGSQGLRCVQSPPRAQAARCRAKVLRGVVRTRLPILVHPILLILALWAQKDLELQLGDFGTPARLGAVVLEALNADDVAQVRGIPRVEPHRCQVSFWRRKYHPKLHLRVGGRHRGYHTTMSLRAQVVHPHQRRGRNVTEHQKIQVVWPVVRVINDELCTGGGSQLLGARLCHVLDPILALHREEGRAVVPGVRLRRGGVRCAASGRLIVARHGLHPVVGHLHLHVRLRHHTPREQGANRVPDTPGLHGHSRPLGARSQIHLLVIQHCHPIGGQLKLVGSGAGNVADLIHVGQGDQLLGPPDADNPLTVVPVDLNPSSRMGVPAGRHEAVSTRHRSQLCLEVGVVRVGIRRRVGDGGKTAHSTALQHKIIIRVGGQAGIRTHCVAPSVHEV